MSIYFTHCLAIGVKENNTPSLLPQKRINTASFRIVHSPSNCCDSSVPLYERRSPEDDAGVFR